LITVIRDAIIGVLPLARWVRLLCKIIPIY
jgi:hypothetical protein